MMMMVITYRHIEQSLCSKDHSKFSSCINSESPHPEAYHYPCFPGGETCAKSESWQVGELWCERRQTGYRAQALTTAYTASHQQNQCGWTCDACRERLELNLEKRRHHSLQALARHIEESGLHPKNGGEPLKGLKQENNMTRSMSQNGPSGDW